MALPRYLEWAICLSIAALAPRTTMGADARSDGWAPIVSTTSAAVVRIKVESGTKPADYGSGVMVDAGAHVLTAKHLLPSSIADAGDGFLISTLAGWTGASIDESQSITAHVDYVSARYDFAILGYSGRAPQARAVCTRAPPRAGEPLLVMGYPGGGNLTMTAGIESGEGQDGQFRTDASVGIGNSGGPVLSSNGQLIGLLLQEPKFKEGEIQLGYFLPMDLVQSDLRNHGMTLLKPCPEGEDVVMGAKPKLLQLRWADHVDRLQETHEAGVTRTDYDDVFPAQSGFVIATAEFHASSANKIVAGPDVVVSPDRNSVHVRYSIESGPFYDRWRGWLDGTLQTVQNAVKD